MSNNLSKEKLFTVFTPTYNRANTLHRVYESLLSQSYKDFEWLIVDDGSTDGTEKLVSNWIADNIFSILYLKKENGGKISAIQHGLKFASGKLFLIADSDDRFVPEALETFQYYYESLNLCAKTFICGVACLCKDSATGEIIGEEFPTSPMVSDAIEIFYKYNVTGEKWGFLKTEILRDYFGPVDLKDVKFLSEYYFWYQIARQYKTIFINIPLRIYYRDTAGSLSKPFLTERHPMGVYLTNEMVLVCTQKYFHLKIKKTLLLLIQLAYAGQAAGVSLSKAISKKNVVLKMLILITWPCGTIVSKIRKRQSVRQGN